MVAGFLAASFAALVAAADLRIHDVQGTAHVSPVVGQDVEGVEGIVTAVSSQGFFLQDPLDDGDPRTSEGIRVASSAKVTVGDRVVVAGSVREARPGCAACSALDEAYANLAVTEIASTSVVVSEHGMALPPPVVVGNERGARSPPRAIFATASLLDVEDAARSLDPAANAIDFYESLEGMRVEIDDATAAGPTVALAGGREELAVVASASSQSPLAPDAGERMFLSNALGAWLPDASLGDSLSGASIGVVDGGIGEYDVLLTGVGPFAVRAADRARAPSVTAPGELAVATFNLENLSLKSPASKVSQLAQIVVRDLGAPDLIAVQEVQDASGSTDDGTVDARPVYAMLVEAIAVAGGPRYAAIDIAPADGEDGGEPGGNIRVAALYRSDRGLALVDRRGAGAHTANAVIGMPPELAYSPGRVAPGALAFAQSRKPLAVEWTFRGATLFSIVVHFDSQRSDPPQFGRFQPAPKPSRVQRIEQAREVAVFVASLLERDPEARVIVLGDFNDVDSSPPMAPLEGIGLRDLVRKLVDQDRYTEIFEGGAQGLDHIMVSPALERVATGIAIAHVDAAFPHAASDHDPVLARFACECEVEPGGCALSCPRRGVGSARPVWTALLAAVAARLRLRRRFQAVESHAEDAAQASAERGARRRNGHAEKKHCPHAKCRGHGPAVAEKLKELVDGLGDGKRRLFLRENERVGHLEHRKREGEDSAGQKVRAQEGQGDPIKSA